MAESGMFASRGVRRLLRALHRGWQWLVVGVVAIALGVAAYASPGLERADVRLDEGVVFATNRSLGLVGAVNTQIREVASATAVGDSRSSVLQHEDVVLVLGEESNTLTPYDPARNRMESPKQLPIGAQVQMVGPYLLISSPENGRVWYGRTSDVLAMDFDKDKAQFEVGIGGRVTLTTSGELIGLDVTRSALVRERDGEMVSTPLPFTVDADRAAAIELSAVGDRAVVLDHSTGRIFVEGLDGVFDVSGAAGAHLLPPVDRVLGGREDVRAAYATEAGLIGVTPDGPRSLSGQMAAAAIQPVQLGDCLYGLFGDRVVRRCPDAEPEIREVPGLDVAGAGNGLAFLVNRRTVALGDAEHGIVWLVDDDMARIDKWDQFVREDRNEPPNPDAPLTNERAQRSDENRAPVAQDDLLSARAGRATILDVLDNDSDLDGDVLTVSAPKEIDGASLQLVRNGTGLQITIPAETKQQTLTFGYEISDGELSDSAQVTVTVVAADPAKANKAPYPFELAQPVTIQKGRSFTKRLLLDWRDPEGDPLILRDAYLPAGSEDLLTFSADGTIHYQDIGKTTGVKKIGVVVSDGTDSAEGELLVNVVEDPVKPVAHVDHATAKVGESITISPLENDFGQNLTLQEVLVEDCESCKMVPDYQEHRFTFEAPSAGTYYLTYNVAAGLIDTGVVRVDVVEPSRDNPPIAALDVAMLPPEGSVFVDPLLNDTDADGDVLVIQTITADPSLEVRLERRHLLTVRAKSTPKAPVTVEYVVSDGRHTARGTVVVIPTESTGSVAPEAKNDEVNVRAGSIVTARVLANDVSPVGLDLKINRILESPLGDDAWIDGDVIRVRAPAGAQRPQAAIPYEVIDEEGNTASATLLVTTINEDAPNLPPVAPDVVDRVLAGSVTRIPIELSGIDPNGDAVRLVGLGAGPRLGRIVEVGEKFLTYEAFPTSEGTDTFRYRVADSLGAMAEGQIRIGIARPGSTNSPPVAAHDTLDVRPGRPIRLPVLANDYDLEGDQFSFGTHEPVKLDDTLVAARIVNDREIAIDPLDEPGTLSGTYRVVDVRGQEGIGSFQVNVRDDAPLLPPTTRDDTLSVQDVVDKRFVEVDVLANDFDADGPHEALKVSVPGFDPDDEQAPRVVGGKVSVPVKETMQQVRYQVTDGDGQSTYGLVTIPGTGEVVPMVRDASRVVVATAGQPTHIDFEDLLVGTRGRAVKLTSTDTIVATTGTAVPATGGVEFTPSADYQGPGAVVFEVADVVPEGDSSAKRAFVTIKVQVRPAANQRAGADKLDLTQLPPEQVTTALLQVGPAEGQSRLSLMPLFRDPQGLDFNFHSWQDAGGDAPITWSTEAGGSVIVAEAPVDAKRGTRRILKGVVENAQSASAPVEVVLEMVGSRQPVTTTNADIVDKAPSGQPLSVPVLTNDVSHLADPTLEVVGARIISGPGTIDHDGQSVTITPAQDFVGTLTASYSVQDATKDPSRVVDGTIRVTVVSRPSQPSAPFNGVVGDGSIRFEYRSSSSNGYPVTKREVTASAAGHSPVTQECSGNTCTITGLRNNVGWTLSVVEYNELGASDPSPESAAYTPDVRPLKPDAPQSTRGDGELTVAWQAARFENPDNAGSPVEQYRLTLFGPQGNKLGTEELPGDRRSHTWRGLTNGTPYSFSLVAVNKAGASDESDRSTPLFPVGPPLGQATIDASPTSSDGGGAFGVHVGPGSLDSNGDPDMRLELVPVVDGSEQASRAVPVAVPPNPAQSIDFQGFGKSAVRFRLYATNLHSRRMVAETTEAQIAWPRPKLELASARATRQWPGKILFTVKTNLTGEDGRRAGNHIDYRIDGGAWTAATPESNGYLTESLPVGVTVRFQVRYTQRNSFDQAEALSETVQVTPVAAQPGVVGRARVAAVDKTHARIEYPGKVSLLESAGWAPEGYRYAVDGKLRQGSYLVVEQGLRKVEQYWEGVPPGESRSQRVGPFHKEEYDVQPVSRVSRSGTRLTVVINYAWGDSACRVFGGQGTNLTLLTEVRSDAEGVIRVDQDFSESADPAAPTPYKRMRVSCTINGKSEGWLWDLD